LVNEIILYYDARSKKHQNNHQTLSAADWNLNGGYMMNAMTGCSLYMTLGAKGLMKWQQKKVTLNLGYSEIKQSGL